MSKEQLEEIEKKYSEIKIIEVLEDVEIVAVDFKDLVYLIKNSFKQAERVFELEEEIDRLNGALHYQLTQENIRNEVNRKLRKQNRRYREVIDEIKRLIPIKYEDEFELSTALISIAKRIEALESDSSE